MIYFITDGKDLNKEAWLRCMIRRIEEGVEYIIIRDKGFFQPDLARGLMDYKRTHKGVKTKIIIHSDLALAKEIDADGVHLPYPIWKKYQQEHEGALEMWRKQKMIGLSVHREEEAQQADGKVDYMFLSPIFHPSCKMVEGKGTAWFKEVQKQIRTPLAALGGITADNIHELYAEGIYDVALMSYLMNENNKLADLKRKKK